MVFKDDTPVKLRNQILSYQMSQCMTDTERASFFGLPEGCRMREGAKIIAPEKLTIGKNCWIGENAILDASGGLEIGDDCQIGLGVYIWTHDTYKLCIKGLDTRENQEKIQRKKTVIGDKCFIGGPSVIMPGVVLGDKCVISPMSVVYESLGDRTIYKPYSDFIKSKKEVISNEVRISSLEEKVRELEAKLLL